MTDYANGTSLELEPGSFACGFVGGRAVCADGQLRTLHPSTDGIPDTFFSIPMFVYVGKVRVYGYATVETVAGYSTATEEDPAVVKFRAYTYRKHHALVGGV